ncbi:Fc.00g026630.m01.CDS01 [Cosmosporella sp. VM-42]
MQYSLIPVIASLALGAVAMPQPMSPASLDPRATVSGNNPGSIFQFGSDSNCRALFWQYGACGLSTYFNNGQVNPNMPLVAIPGSVFNQYGASQNNKLCAKVITMTRNGVTRQAVVADQNVGGDNSIDMCLGLWQAFGGHDNDGSILQGMQWSINY